MKNYVVFSLGEKVVALLGPYDEAADADRAKMALLTAETSALKGLDIDAPAHLLCIPSFYTSARVLPLHPDEVRALAG